MKGQVCRLPTHLVALALTLQAVAACSGRDTRPEDWSLTSTALLNADYHSEWVDGGRVRLRDGKYEDPEARLRVIEAEHAFGDLDGLGSDDAAVVLVTDPGGSGVFYDLAAVVNTAGEPESIASVALGDRVNLHSLRIADRRIDVDLTIHGPDDPMCCPSMRVVATYELRGNRLIEVSRTPFGDRSVGSPEGSDLYVTGEFKALGNEPFWNVDITKRGIAFERLGEGRIVFPYTEPDLIAGKRVYSAATTGEPRHAIEIVISRERCVDNMSGAHFEYTARVTFDRSEYTGCAKAGPN